MKKYNELTKEKENDLPIILYAYLAINNFKGYKSKLRLCQIIYLSAIYYYKKFSKHMFIEDFQAWNYGATLPRAFCFKIKEINIDLWNKLDLIDVNIKNCIDKIVVMNANKLFFSLVEKNVETAPYLIVREKNGFGATIPKKLIADYAKNLIDENGELI